MFQYIRIEDGGRRFFCLQQNLAVMAWALYFKKDPLRPITWPDSKKLSLGLFVRWLRNKYRKFRKNIIILIIFTCHKYHLRKADSTIQLPIYGHICVPVHRGYKLFDFRRGVVVKIFDHDVNPSSILSEIEWMKKVSAIHFAPSLRRWNIAERWYEEDYVSGSLGSSSKPLESAPLLQQFYGELVQQINSLILFQRPITKNPIEYIHEMINILGIRRLLKQQLGKKEFRNIERFLNSMVERLCVEGDCSVFLVFTHGDFCPANMMNARKRIKIIDWESAKYRSALFDFYSYFFYRSVSRKVPMNIVVSEINEALPFFISDLTKKAPEISQSLLALKKTYRWLYYIERICMLVERQKSDKRLNILEDIFRSMQAFACYENILAGEESFSGGEIDSFLIGNLSPNKVI